MYSPPLGLERTVSGPGSLSSWAVPVVHNSSGLQKLWAVAPVLAMDNMEDITEVDLVTRNKIMAGREVALAPYWSNKIDSVRREYQIIMIKEDQIR